MHKPIYLDLQILEITKTLMYKFCYNYIKPRYQDKVNLSYIYTDSFLVNLKTDDVYKDIENDVGNRFEILNYENEWPKTIGKNAKAIRLMKNE